MKATPTNGSRWSDGANKASGKSQMASLFQLRSMTDHTQIWTKCVNLIGRGKAQKLKNARI